MHLATLWLVLVLLLPLFLGSSFCALQQLPSRGLSAPDSTPRRSLKQSEDRVSKVEEYVYIQKVLQNNLRSRASELSADLQEGGVDPLKSRLEQIITLKSWVGADYSWGRKKGWDYTNLMVFTWLQPDDQYAYIKGKGLSPTVESMR